MEIVQIAGDIVTLVLKVTTAAAWPPFGTGAFWTVTGIYAIVSILFDDETPRGNPGVNYLSRSTELRNS